MVCSYLPDGVICGLDFGSSKVLSKIRYYPPAQYLYRMNGGKFQISSNGTDYQTIHTVQNAIIGWNEIFVTPAINCRYARYLSPDGGYGNISEIEFYS